MWVYSGLALFPERFWGVAVAGADAVTGVKRAAKSASKVETVGVEGTRPVVDLDLLTLTGLGAGGNTSACAPETGTDGDTVEVGGTTGAGGGNIVPGAGADKPAATGC